MEFASRRIGADFVHRVSKRIRSLRKIDPRKIWPKLSSQLLAPSLIACGLLSAATAYHLSGQDALEGWLRGHLPTAKIWNAGFSAFDYERVSDPKLLQKIYRTIPSSAEPVGSVWKSTEGARYAIFAEADAPFLVFQAEDAPGKFQWEPIGRGWPALDHALQSAETYAHELKKRHSLVKTRPLPLDPREIRY